MEQNFFDKMFFYVKKFFFDSKYKMEKHSFFVNIMKAICGVKV